MTTGIEAWLFGYAGGKIANAIMSMFKEDKFIKGLHDAINKWTSTLPKDAHLDASIVLFPNHILNDGLEDRPALNKIHDQFNNARIPTIEEWHSSLIEQYKHVKKTKENLQDFFIIPEEQASQHLLNLAKSLRKVCEQNDNLFKGEVIKLLLEIIKTQSADIIATDAPQELTEDQHALLKRLYDYDDGFCRISTPKGEYKCLWVPGDVGGMQWGWERTPTEVELSGKSKGDKQERLKWLYVVKGLLELGLLQEIEKENGCFELSEEGQRIAHDLSIQEKTNK